ncbi:hypothetical protein C2E23DRAFT_901636 [Lenzites betulinus]|nr:hypothetical protein C2E23DRAFT_901636 [Lenzites betulinus]
MAHRASLGFRIPLSLRLTASSFNTGTFEDVKFYLFSRRSRSGVVYAPRPLFANTALLCKASSHFDFVLSPGFAEGETVDMNAPYPSDREPSTEDYDYAADSDLEDDPSPEWSNFKPQSKPLNFTKPRSEQLDDIQTPPKPEPAPYEQKGLGDGVEREGAGVPQADISEWESTSGSPKGDVKSKGSGPPKPVVSQAIRKGRVVYMEDIAYRTWEAFIFYAYFGTVSFAALRSQRAGNIPHKPFEPPPCSPKSMYRLADKYDIQPLKELALEDIRNKMAKDNILVELFSTYALTYKDVQDSLMNYLRDHITQSDMWKQLPSWCQALDAGTLPHGSVDILSRILVGAASRSQRW